MAQEIQSVDADDWSPLTPVSADYFQPDRYDDRALFHNVPYYLKHLPDLANAVVQEGDDAGFIDLPVWRQPHASYNLRVQESHVAFACFYTTQASWNPWYGDPRLRTRLEAALQFIDRKRLEDGTFTEYGPDEPNAAATSFGARALVRTLDLLEGGPAIAPEAMAAGQRAAREAVLTLLREDRWFSVGENFANQIESVWYSAPTYVHLYGDDEIDQLVRSRLPESQRFQSPAGFFYEDRGVDWGYNLGTHIRDVHKSIYQVRDHAPEIVEEIQDRERRFYEWLSYNAVPEPNGEGFVLNGGIQTRRLHYTSFEHLGDLPATAEIATSRAFALTREQAMEEVAQRRAQLAALGSDAVDALDRYQFPVQALSLPSALPTQTQRDEAIRQLPMHRSDRFVHRRLDARLSDGPMSFTFVRRPGYYAIFNAGPRIRAHQRFGMGLIWTPQLGSVLQNPTAETTDPSAAALRPSWGVTREAFTEPAAMDPNRIEWWVDGQLFQSDEAIVDLPEGEFKLRSALEGGGDLTWRFLDHKIVGEIEVAGDFFFQIPLLASSTDALVLEPGRLTLNDPLGQLEVRWNTSSDALVQAGTSSVLGKQRLFVAIPATDSLEVTFLMPEPSSVGLLGMAGWLCLKRPRRSRSDGR